MPNTSPAEAHRASPVVRAGSSRPSTRFAVLPFALVALATLAFASFGCACAAEEPEPTPPTAEDTATPRPDISYPDGDPAQDATATPEPRVEPDEDLGDRPAIVITEPRAGETIDSPVTLRGESNTAEPTFLVEVVAPTGAVVTEQVVTGGGSGGDWRAFAVPLEFETASGRGWIVAYERSADGSRINEYRVPVTFE